MTNVDQPAYLDTPEARQAYPLLQRSAQEALSGVAGQTITLTVGERRAVTPSQIEETSKDVLIEFQFERPLEVHHSIVVLAEAAAITRAFSLNSSAEAGELLDAETLLSLGDIVSTFLDTLAGDLPWLQPKPRAWLANLEPIAPDATGSSLFEIPSLLANGSPLYMADVTLTADDTISCPLQIMFNDVAEKVLLGLEEPAEVAPPPPPPSPKPAATSDAQSRSNEKKDEDAPRDGAQSARPVAPPVQPVQFKPLGHEQSTGKSSGIDLIKDVSLHVSVELGRASLTVREILALGVGSVVELDRLAGEPVDVLVNDRLIARGEVVIVDESFGVRITEIFRESSKRGVA